MGVSWAVGLRVGAVKSLNSAQGRIVSAYIVSYPMYPPKDSMHWPRCTMRSTSKGSPAYIAKHLLWVLSLSALLLLCQFFWLAEGCSIAAGWLSGASHRAGYRREGAGKGHPRDVVGLRRSGLKPFIHCTVPSLDLLQARGPVIFSN